MQEFNFRGNDGKAVVVRSLNRINIILGRNGAGKSRLLRTLDECMSAEARFRVRYITPERAGAFKRDGGIETNLISSPGWGSAVRRANQSAQFKAMSHFYLRNAESAYLRKLQNTDARGRSFQEECLDPISRLLSNVSIEQGEPDFVFRSAGGELIAPDGLSSGESEAITLAAELLNFFQALDEAKLNVLLLDEPDVHQHPDLQARLGRYLLDQIASLTAEHQSKVVVLLATHSTPLVCALAGSDHTSVGTKEFDSATISLAPLSDQVKKVAPFFGHPLSLSLSGDPMLILEGEDDERVWQQAARSSEGRVRVFPVLANSVDQQSELEAFCGPMLSALYDNPIAFSLRDGDGTTGSLTKQGPVVRFRLQCYAIENTLLTTECLKKLGVDWESFKQRAAKWIEANQGHRDCEPLRQLIDSTDRHRHKKIKALRTLIVSIAGSNKPWEVVVGQALASTIGAPSKSADPFALLSFVGTEAAKELLHAT